MRNLTMHDLMGRIPVKHMTQSIVFLAKYWLDR
jgi:hypothetical protein